MAFIKSGEKKGFTLTKFYFCSLLFLLCKSSYDFRLDISEWNLSSQRKKSQFSPWVSNADNLMIIRLKRKKGIVNKSSLQWVFPDFYMKYNTKGKCGRSKDHDI